MVDHLKSGKAIVKYLRGHESPETVTVQDLAAKFDLPEADVVKVLDEYRVGPQGGVSHEGEGAGGGWVESAE